MRIRIPLTAGVIQRQSFKGQGVVIKSLGAAASVAFTLFGVDQQDREEFGQCESLFSVYSPDRIYSGVELLSTVDCIVDLIVSRSRVEVMDGATVTATIAAGQLPLPVSNDRGNTALNPVHVSGAILGDTPAGTVTDAAAVAVTAAGAAVLAADATRLEAVFYNIGPDPVALGMAGITWAKRAIVLTAGDMFVESRAAAKAWTAITAAGTTASVTVQERKA